MKLVVGGEGVGDCVAVVVRVKVLLLYGWWVLVGSVEAVLTWVLVIVAGVHCCPLN